MVGLSGIQGWLEYHCVRPETLMMIVMPRKDQDQPNPTEIDTNRPQHVLSSALRVPLVRSPETRQEHLLVDEKDIYQTHIISTFFCRALFPLLCVGASVNKNVCV